MTTFKGRINRGAYALGILTLFFGLFALFIISIPVTLGLNWTLRIDSPLTILPIIAAISAVYFFYFTSITARRLHDVNLSGYFAVFQFVPYINLLMILVLLVIPGDTSENKYGKHGRSFSFKTLFLGDDAPASKNKYPWLVPLAIAIVVLIVGATFIWDFNFLGGVICKNTVFESMPAPDGINKAIVFSRDCGATTDWVVGVSIIKATDSLSDSDDGNVFRADDGGNGALPSSPTGGPLVTASWDDSTHLEIQYTQGAEIFNQIHTYHGIDIADGFSVMGDFSIPDTPERFSCDDHSEFTVTFPTDSKLVVSSGDKPSETLQLKPGWWRPVANFTNDTYSYMFVSEDQVLVTNTTTQTQTICELEK